MFRALFVFTLIVSSLQIPLANARCKRGQTWIDQINRRANIAAWAGPSLSLGIVASTSGGIYAGSLMHGPAAYLGGPAIFLSGSILSFAPFCLNHIAGKREQALQEILFHEDGNSTAFRVFYFELESRGYVGSVSAITNLLDRADETEVICKRSRLGGRHYLSEKELIGKILSGELEREINQPDQTNRPDLEPTVTREESQV